MTWDELPLELHEKILTIHHKLREEAQTKIIRCWEKFQAPKKVAYYLVEKERFGLPMSIMFPEAASIIKYCAKVLSGKEKQIYWFSVLSELEYELWLNKNNSGPALSRVRDAFIKLIEKFEYILGCGRTAEFTDYYDHEFWLI
jgi:hypothetical protein